MTYRPKSNLLLRHLGVVSARPQPGERWVSRKTGREVTVVEVGPHGVLVSATSTGRQTFVSRDGFEASYLKKDAEGHL